jgi:hypothetical protein
VSVIALFVVLIVWCVGCSEWTADQVDCRQLICHSKCTYFQRERKRGCVNTTMP